MTFVLGLFQIVQPGVWRQTIEILIDGHTIGYVERERTRTGMLIKTRNMRGDVMDGECLEWLRRQTA